MNFETYSQICNNIYLLRIGIPIDKKVYVFSYDFINPLLDEYWKAYFCQSHILHHVSNEIFSLMNVQMNGPLFNAPYKYHFGQS